MNSANILIPKIDYPIKTILALFNSTPYQFIYQKKFGAIKVLKKDIESLPLPELSDCSHDAIEQMVDELLNCSLGFQERRSLHNKVDGYIMDLFQFSEDEKDFLLNEVKNSDKLLELN